MRQPMHSRQMAIAIPVQQRKTARLLLTTVGSAPGQISRPLRRGQILLPDHKSTPVPVPRHPPRALRHSPQPRRTRCRLPALTARPRRSNRWLHKRPQQMWTGLRLPNHAPLLPHRQHPQAAVQQRLPRHPSRQSRKKSARTRSLSGLGLIYCAGGTTAHFSDPPRQIATAILLERSEK